MKYDLFKIKIEHLRINTETKSSDYLTPYYTQITVMEGSYNVIRIIKCLVEDLFYNYFKN